MKYNPDYDKPPFTDFSSITSETDLKTLNLNWTEKDLPERQRTKNVHRLHPYLGKYIPQLVEIFLRKYSPKTVYDPFCGSGTTLIEANILGIDSVGVDISTFNCLISKVKTDKYNILDVETDIYNIIEETKNNLYKNRENLGAYKTDSEYVNSWFSENARRELLCYLSLIPNYQHQDLLKVILSRSARSARLTTHFDLDFPKKPQIGPYKCYKHGKICKPTDEAFKFLKRYSTDTIKRIKEFSKIRTDAKVDIFCEDSRKVVLPEIDLVITSPPYVGLIDYHEQHRYSYELLGLDKKEELEIGAAYKGRSNGAKKEYIEQIGEVFANARKYLKDDGVVVIVVHDKDALYEELAPKIGFELEEKLKRHVNRRTGRRGSDFFEEILIWRKK
jgi:site-specific DNA-adenine methylase